MFKIKPVSKFREMKGTHQGRPNNRNIQNRNRLWPTCLCNSLYSSHLLTLAAWPCIRSYLSTCLCAFCMLWGYPPAISSNSKPGFNCYLCRKHISFRSPLNPPTSHLKLMSSYFFHPYHGKKMLSLYSMNLNFLPISGHPSWDKPNWANSIFHDN